MKKKRTITIVECLQFENYLLTPVLYQEDQVLQLPGILVKKLLLELREAGGERAGAGLGLIQGSSEVPVDPGAGALAKAWCERDREFGATEPGLKEPGEASS